VLFRSLKGTAGLELNVEFKLGPTTLESRNLEVVETLVAPQSPLVGHTLKQLDFGRHYGALVLAILRRGEPLREKLNAIPLEVGDALLVQASPDDVRRLRDSGAVIVLDAVETPSTRRHRAPLALAILAGVVLSAGLGLVPILTSALLGCLALILTGCLTLDEAYAAIEWRVVFLLAGILPLGLALESTGVAGLVAKFAIEGVGPWGPTAALAAIYLITAVLTEMMSNNAAAVLVAPIAVSTAAALGVDPRPFLIGVTFAASTSFSTPVGYQTNAMVFNPGGYRARDFLRAGAPLNAIFWLLSVWLIPKFWPF
jgi:di/tricarboxylate transporter